MTDKKRCAVTWNTCSTPKRSLPGRVNDLACDGANLLMPFLHRSLNVEDYLVMFDDKNAHRLGEMQCAEKVNGVDLSAVPQIRAPRIR